MEFINSNLNKTKYKNDECKHISPTQPTSIASSIAPSIPSKPKPSKHKPSKHKSSKI